MQENVVNKDAESYSYLSHWYVYDAKQKKSRTNFCPTGYVTVTGSHPHRCLEISVLPNCLVESSLPWSKAETKESCHLDGFSSCDPFLIYFKVNVNPVSLTQVGSKAITNNMDF